MKEKHVQGSGSLYQQHQTDRTMTTARTFLYESASLPPRNRNNVPVITDPEMKGQLDQLTKVFSLIRTIKDCKGGNGNVRITSTPEVVCDEAKATLESQIQRKLEKVKLEDLSQQTEAKALEMKELVAQIQQVKKTIVQRAEEMERLMGAESEDTLDLRLQILRDKLSGLKEELENQKQGRVIHDPEDIKGLLQLHKSQKKEHGNLNKKLNKLSVNGSLPCSYSLAEMNLLERRNYLLSLKQQIIHLQGDNSSVFGPS